MCRLLLTQEDEISMEAFVEMLRTFEESMLVDLLNSFAIKNRPDEVISLGKILGQDHLGKALSLWLKSPGWCEHDFYTIVELVEKVSEPARSDVIWAFIIPDNDGLCLEDVENQILLLREDLREEARSHFKSRS